MDWLDKLERRFGRFAVPHLMEGILIGQLAAWFIIMFLNADLCYYLPLTRAGLAHGQIWRVVTFLLVPSYLQSFGLPFMLITLYFYWWIGGSLVRAWGDFRFTVYILAGVLGALVGCLLTGSASSSGVFLSLFFAYAWMWPEQQVLLFFVIPVKMKWMGWAALAVWLLEFLSGSLASRIGLVFGLAGFLAFFGREVYFWCKDTVVNYKRSRDWRNRNR